MVDEERQYLGKTGRAGNEYRGLVTFPNPGCSSVTLTSDEITASCPVTDQPDWYVVSVTVSDAPKCIESKSFKLYMHSFRTRGLFCEALAVEIAGACRDATGAGSVYCVVSQKSRGGVVIKATVTLRS